VRPRLTAFVIVAVLGVGVAAAVDALPDGDDGVNKPAGPSAGTAEAVAALRSAGVRGLITYSDERCRLHAVRLPALRGARAPAITSCEPRFPTGGILAWEGNVVWSGLGFQTVQVVLTRERIDSAVSRWLDVGELGLIAAQAVSLAPRRYAMLLEDEAQADYLAFFEGDRALAVYPLSDEDHVLRPSPRGNYVALLTRGAGVQVFTRAGEPQRLPPVANPHAIAWSPDDDWTAIATSRSVYVFRSGEDDNTLPRIPLAVRDLDWDA
jgi:hypothetical protein